MFRTKLPAAPAVALKPFALKIREGVLVGLAIDAEHGTPCVDCVRGWLKDRNIQTEKIDPSTISADAKAHLNKLINENAPHVMWEIMDSGQKNRLECIVFPHPRCQCHKVNFMAPKPKRKQTNLAFSPIFQIKCVRYGTPKGNLWFFTAMGQSPITMKIIAAHGTHADKEQARGIALDNWLKKATETELSTRVESGEAFYGNDIQTGEEKTIASNEELTGIDSVMGIGKTQQDAIQDGFYNLAKKQTLEEYANLGKNPMLIVGSNNWLRNLVPFFLIQQYDLYPLFYPNKSKAWVVGLAAFSRISTEDKPIFAFGSDADINSALRKAIHQILQLCRPIDWRNRKSHTAEETQKKKASKLNSWWTHWVYRCPKISLKDVLQLEKYPTDLAVWKEYLRSRGDMLTSIDVNSPLLPQDLRSLVKLNLTQIGDKPYTRASNVRGIATWASMRNSLS